MVTMFARVKRWPRAVIVLIVVALALAGYGAYRLTRPTPVDPADPKAAAERFLAALQKGDAQAALAECEIPEGDRSLLTDEVLATRARDGRGVTAYSFGEFPINFEGFRAHGPTVRAKVTVGKVAGEWSLPFETVAGRVRLGCLGDAGDLPGGVLTADGVLMGERALLFPGDVTFASATPWVMIGGKATRSVQPMARVTHTIDMSELTLVPTAEAKAKVHDAIGQQIRDCIAHPRPECPTPLSVGAEPIRMPEVFSVKDPDLTRHGRRFVGRSTSDLNVGGTAGRLPYEVRAELDLVSGETTTRMDG